MTNNQVPVHGGAAWVARPCCEAAPIRLVQNKKADWILTTSSCHYQLIYLLKQYGSEIYLRRRLKYQLWRDLEQSLYSFKFDYIFNFKS